MARDVLDLYSKGTKVWVHSNEHVWSMGIVTHPLVNNVLLVEVDDGQTVTVKVNGDSTLPPLCNPELLIGANDLTHLSFLHEPAVLYNLKVRFLDLSTIYTYCGIILVAINPYQSLPIYGSEAIAAYHSNDSRDMDPHVYGVMEEAFRQMKRENRNQSVIVSGESGSGKTVSAKYGLRYLASVCGAVAETKIERKVLSSNPIMESIGNAKTTRNDNSSRFGKYLEIGFSKSQTILGATMKTFLLEKSRVVAQGDGERNYHIFYQLCAMRNDPQFEDLQLLAAEEFHYTNQGSSTTIDGVDDEEDFTMLSQSFYWLGFSTDQHSSLFKLLASILHLGNVAVRGRRYEDASYIESTGEGIALVSKLLGLPPDSLCKWLCNKKIVTKHETLIKPFNVLQAVNARDSFSKHLYAHLFNWIVTKINHSLQSLEKHYSFIGILDIYGFEVFKVNSFEQFCINYANEKLQQQFNMHVFKLEQQEYVQEGIEWSFINYYDNQPCIDLIEGSLGILDLLDETCRMPGSSDDMFIRKLYNNYIDKNGSSHNLGDATNYFSKPRTSTSSFNVHHYAYVVTYEKDLFTDKNMDSLIPEHREMLQNSKDQFVAELFQSMGNSNIPVKKQKSDQRNGASVAMKSSVGSQFRDSLTDLMKALNSTNPHYIRCVKPNDSKTAFEFNPQRVIEQLRACGVLETIRISAAGFPSRCQYYEFFCRYFMLLKWGQRRKGEHKSMANYVLENCIADPDKYQLGKTKIFFRAGQVAYLERLRTDKIHQSVVLLQSHIKGWSQRKKYVKICTAVKGLQRHGRGLIARRIALHLRQTRAAIKIQSVYRMHRERRHYKRICLSILLIQCYYRKWKATLLVSDLRLVKAAVIFQKYWRGRQGRLHCCWRKRSIVMVQCRVRMWSAKRKLRALKVEARSVDHIKSLKKGLEIKIIELQQKLMHQEEITHNLNNDINDLTISREQLLTKAGFYEEYLILKERVKELEIELDTKKTDEEYLQEQLNELKVEMEKSVETHKQELETYSEHVQFLKNQLQEAVQSAVTEETLSHTEADWDRLKQEHTLLQQHHQNMLLHKSELEEQMVKLSDELETTKCSLPTPSTRYYSKMYIDDNNPGSSPDLSDIEPLSSSPIKDESTNSLKLFLPTPVSLMKTPTSPLDAATPPGTATPPDVATPPDTVAPLVTSTPPDTITGGVTSITDSVTGADLDRLHSNTQQDSTEDVQRLQSELKDVRRRFKEARKEHDCEITRMKQENQRLQDELNVYETNDYSGIVALNKSLHTELNKLLEENTVLKEKLQVAESALSPQEVALVALTPRKSKDQASLFADDSSTVVYRSLQEKPCLGMLSWQLGDLPLILKSIILESTSVVRDVPCKEAHILLMCLRYADHCNSEEMTSTLIEGVVSNVHTILQVHRHNLHMLSFWLGNVTCFLNNLRQYSGDPLYQQQPPVDVVQLTSQTSLTSFELSDYHHLVMDQAIHLYHGVFKIIREKIEPMIVPGLMEHNPLPGISSSANVSSIRKLLGGGGAESSGSKHKVTVDDVERCLSGLMYVLRDCAVSPSIIGQLLKQVFYFINAHMLNYLLLRKDMCHWSRGVQMRYNLNVLEEWVREHWAVETTNNEEESASVMLQPMIQACKLLQMKKQTIGDIDDIIELCKDLNLVQIQKLVTMYTSSNGLEQRVLPHVIKYISRKEKSVNEPMKLMVDASYQFPINFPFSCSYVDYSDIKLPKQLNHLIKI